MASILGKTGSGESIFSVAGAIHAEWRVLYNDFSVAEEINREMGRKHAVFMGKVRQEAKPRRIMGINWHGLTPLLLHFHLDLSPLHRGQRVKAGVKKRRNLHFHLDLPPSTEY